MANNPEKNNDSNVTWHRATVYRDRRKKPNRSSFNVWFTGLSCSGKSAPAHALEEHLHRAGYQTFVFDSDNVTPLLPFCKIDYAVPNRNAKYRKNINGHL